MTTIPNARPPVKLVDLFQQLFVNAAVPKAHSNQAQMAADSLHYLRLDIRSWDLGRLCECIRDLGGTLLEAIS